MVPTVDKDVEQVGSCMFLVRVYMTEKYLENC